MLSTTFVFALLASCSAVRAQVPDDYEYIVVGSGAGGGPLAARLALAGHRTLLIEAGDDQGTSYNYTVPAYSPLSTEDPDTAWDFFVRHFADDEEQRKDSKVTYTCPGRRDYTGPDPPADCTIKGVLYPRAGTLGGCTAHNALINVYPHESDFSELVEMTGDNTWSPENMRKYLIRLEAVNYLQSIPDLLGHGTDGWLGVSHTPINLITDVQALSFLLGSIFTLGNWTGTPLNLATALAGDMNAYNSLRDHLPAIYQVLLSSKDGHRVGPRDFLVAVRDAVDRNGGKAYPLDIKLNTHVTKVTFDETFIPAKATGVEYLEGKYLYKASKRAGSAGPGTPGSVRATREVIVAGGSYNSPQILKLSGIGPADELNSFGIPVIKDLPGVGTNLQDHYEIAVNADTPNEFPALAGCTLGASQPDPCLEQWTSTPRLGSIYGAAYDSGGFGAAVYLKTSVATKDNFDVMALGGPATFKGYYPNYSIDAITGPPSWSWVILKAHPRSRAGSVTLRSADPLDMPYINYEFFRDGAEEDLQAMYEGIQFGREALRRQPVAYTESLPGTQYQSKADLFKYTKSHAWSHHASSTCPIGADNDPMAVLDSKFRVRGVQGLRVVDASIYPRIPGTFTALSTYLIGEKAADDILADVRVSKLARFRRMFQ